MGFNEYDLRQLLGIYLTLDDAKELFMECVKSGTEQGIIEDPYLFRHHSKQVLWKMHFVYLQSINYELMRRLKKNLKGICFAHSYVFNKPALSKINYDDANDT